MAPVLLRSPFDMTTFVGGGVVAIVLVCKLSGNCGSAPEAFCEVESFGTD